MTCGHLRQYLPGTEQTLPCAFANCIEGSDGGGLRTIYMNKETGQAFDQRWGRLKIESGAGFSVYLWSNTDAQIAPEVVK